MRTRQKSLDPKRKERPYGQPRTGEAEPNKRMGSAPEKLADENKAGQEQKAEKRADDRNTGIAEKRAEEQKSRSTDQPRNRAEGQRTGESKSTRDPAQATKIERSQQAPREDQAGAGDARRTDQQRTDYPRVMGRIKGSEEHAARVGEELQRVGHHESGEFDFEVGTRLPDALVIEPHPPEIIAIAPEYRGYDYVYVNDNIVFVEQGTHEVVGMIQLGDSLAANDEPRLSRARPCPVD